MISSCSPSEPEELSHLLMVTEGLKTVDGNAVCRLLKACHSDQDYFMLFACLPKLMQQSTLNTEELTDIALLLPINFLQRLLSSSGGQNSEHFQNLAIDVLSVVLANFSPKDLVDVLKLQRPLFSLLKRRELENICCILLKLTYDMVDVSKFTDLLNLTCGSLNGNDKELPSLTLLKCVVELLERLVRFDTSGRRFLQESWPTDLRFVLTKLFRSREIAQDYHRICLGIAKTAMELLGFQWFNSEKHFAMIVVAIAEVELQLLLDNPKKTLAEELVICASIIDQFIYMTNSDEFLDDERATQVSINCQRVVSYVCHFLLESEKDESVEVDKNIMIILLRLICSFLAVDGAVILDKELLTNVIPVLIKIARENIMFGDGCLCELLLENLTSVGNLPNFSLGFALDYVETYASDKAVAHVRDFVSAACCESSRWYTNADIQRAKSISCIASDPELMEFLCSLR